MKRVFIRTCQECMTKVESQTGPNPGDKVTAAYENKTCSKCKSQAFDRGSFQLIAETPEEQKQLDDDN